MIELPHKISATIAFARTETTAFYQLPAIIGRVLTQTGATITALDLGLRGDSIRYVTDHGEVALYGRLGSDWSRQAGVSCDALIYGTRDSGRQLCFQIVRRMIGRLSVSSVFWQPTRQRMTPESFTWDSLTEAAQRWSPSPINVINGHR
ncbi:hypothetical protein [Palleronia sp.]|uniref:hypothetical protein n=1 Tax=Palleronia sp. TaxID=1940284 RepID=UPI0035C7A978